MHTNLFETHTHTFTCAYDFSSLSAVDLDLINVQWNVTANQLLRVSQQKLEPKGLILDVVKVSVGVTLSFFLSERWDSARSRSGISWIRCAASYIKSQKCRIRFRLRCENMIAMHCVQHCDWHALLYNMYRSLTCTLFLIKGVWVDELIISDSNQ